MCGQENCFTYTKEIIKLIIKTFLSFEYQYLRILYNIKIFVETIFSKKERQRRNGNTFELFGAANTCSITRDSLRTSSIR